MKGWFFLYNKITGLAYTIVEWKSGLKYRLSEIGEKDSALKIKTRIKLAELYKRPSIIKRFIIITEKNSEEYYKLIDFIGNIILEKTGFDSYNFIEI
jgi:hypothetical protein